jgi:hypothetical protein
MAPPVVVDAHVIGGRLSLNNMRPLFKQFFIGRRAIVCVN